MTLSITKNENSININVGAFDSAAATAILSTHSAFGLTLDSSVDASAARTTLEVQDFSTRADFVTWASGKTPTAGLIKNAAGLRYEYDGVSTEWLDLPGWKLATPRLPTTAAIYAPAVTTVAIGDLVAETKYNSMPGPFRKVSGELSVVWNGNDATGSIEGQAGQLIYMSDSSDNGATWGAKYAPFVSSTYSTNPFTGSDTEWMQAVPVNYKGVTYVNWTSGRFNPNQGEFMSTRTTGKWTNTKLLYRASDGAIVARPELLAADLPAGFSHLWTVDGAAWFPQIEWMKVFDGVLYCGVTLIEPTLSFSLAPKKNIVIKTTDGVTYSLGTTMPWGMIQTPQTLEWDVIRLPDGRFRAYIRVNFQYAGGESITSTEAIAYKYAVSESSDLMGWSGMTFLPVANHVQRITTTQLPGGFWAVGYNGARLSRNDISAAIIRDGGAFSAAVPLSNETVASQWANTPGIYYDATTGRVYTAWSVAPNSGGYTNPCEIRVSSFSVMPSAGTLNVTPENRKDAPAVSGTTMTFAGYATAGVDVPTDDYTLTFRYSLIGSALTASQIVPVCSIGSAQIGLQVQLRSTRVEICPVGNGRVGTPLRTFVDTSISVTCTKDFIQINGHRFWIPGSGEFHFGDYHETGSGLTASYLSVDMATVHCGKAAYSNPTSNWYGAPGRNVIRNGDFQWDQRLSGGSYGASTGTKLDGWAVFDLGGIASGLTVARTNYSAASAATYGGIRTRMKVQSTTLGTSAFKIGQYFENVWTMAGDAITIEFDLYDAGGGSLPVTLEWWQVFGTGGSPSSTVKTLLGTAYVTGVENRFSSTFVVPKLSTTASIGSNFDDYAAIVFSVPFHQTTADLQFGRVRMCSGLSARGYGSDNDDQVLAEYFPIRGGTASTGLVNGTMISDSEFRGVVKYPNGRRVPTLTSIGTSFNLISAAFSANVTPTLAFADKDSGTIRITGLSGFTGGQGAILRDGGAGDTALFFNRRIL